MNDVRQTLFEAWDRLTKVGRTFDLKRKLDSSNLDNLIAELFEVEQLITEAKHQACAYLTDVAYAIAKEDNPEEYTAFTHGPSASLEAMLGCAPEEGAILVQITMTDGRPKYQALKGYLDGQWMDC